MTSRRRSVALVALITAGLGLTAAPAQAAKPTFQMPFSCGERWNGSSRATHSPSPLSVDWNRDAYDLGKIAVASAPGVVTSVTNLGNTSYGRYIVIDHGGRWTTLHAHLSAFLVTVGQQVDQGQPIGLVGNSGGSSGPHLHYEQRFDRVDRHASFDGRRFEYGTWQTSRNCVDVPVAGDWNGDRATDVGVFVRKRGTSVFRQLMPDGTRSRVEVGVATDAPIVGDWDGDGQTDVGVRRFANRTFYLVSASGRRTPIQFGKRTALPVIGDWDGDGRDDVGVFDPARSMFRLRDHVGAVTTKSLGSPGSLPVAGDWDGDGRDNVGVYDQAAATFTLSMPDDTTTTIQAGSATSLPVSGDWDGDGIFEVGTWDRLTGTFSQRLGPNKVTSVRFGRPR